MNFDKMSSLVGGSVNKSLTIGEIQDFMQIHFHYVKPDTELYENIDTRLDAKLRSVIVSA